MWMILPKTAKYNKLFLAMLLVCIALRAIWLDLPSDGLIFDEYYYVNTARNVLRLPMPAENPYSHVPPGIDGNTEHPGLFKAFIALSILAFGNNGWGWRAPSVILGSLAIVFFYLLVRRLTDKEALPLLAAFLFSFDNLFFIHSRIALLDIAVLSFSILAYYAYISNRMWLTGVALGLASSCKITGLFSVATILFYHVFIRIGYERSGNVKEKVKALLPILLTFLAVFVGAVALIDHYTSTYTNPLEHLQFILTSGLSLTAETLTGIESAPWEWAFNQKTITYLQINVEYIVDDVVKASVPKYVFAGAMNPVLAYLFLPAVGYAVYLLPRKGNKTLIFFALSMIAMQYLPYFAMRIIWHRITYLHYILPTVPAMAMLVSEGITEHKLKVYELIVFVAIYIAGFALFFPFKMLP